MRCYLKEICRTSDTDRGTKFGLQIEPLGTKNVGGNVGVTGARDMRCVEKVGCMFGVKLYYLYNSFITKLCQSTAKGKTDSDFILPHLTRVI